MFKLGVVFFSLLVFVVSTGGALGVVWLKQQISRTAESCMMKEKELVVLQRTHIYLQSAIAQVHNPDHLKAQVANRLSMPSKKQIVWMNSEALKGDNRYVVGKGLGREPKVKGLENGGGNRIVQ